MYPVGEMSWWKIFQHSNEEDSDRNYLSSGFVDFYCLKLQYVTIIKKWEISEVLVIEHQCLTFAGWNLPAEFFLQALPVKQIRWPCAWPLLAHRTSLRWSTTVNCTANIQMINSQFGLRLQQPNRKQIIQRCINIAIFSIHLCLDGTLKRPPPLQ